MSDSILSLLADDLDIPPKQAKKLLIAMLREVKKRAHREGVRLPDFGTFRASNGEITFEPSPSLARAVNSRFEGLQSENLDTAPTTEEDDEEEDEGPNTITLGYQESEWSPLEEESDDTTDGDEEEEADTEEFEVPSAEEAADTATTDAASEATPVEPESREEPAEQEPSETEELYPFVEDAPDGDAEEEEAGAARQEAAQQEAAQRQEAADEEHDSLSGIWDDDEDESDQVSDPDEESTAAVDFLSESEPSAEPTPEPEPEPSTESSPHPDAPTSEVEIDPEVQEPGAEAAEASSDDGGSTGVLVMAGILVVLLLGGAAWFVLGQQGTVQSPQKTFAQLQGEVQPYVENLSAQDIPLVGTSSEESSSAPADAGDESSSPTTAEANNQPSGGSDTRSDAGDPSEEPAESDATTQTETAASESTDPTSGTTQTGSSQGIDQGEGGWTIIVGSRTGSESAQSLVDKYRSVFADRNLPVDVIPGTVENTTRYRVGVGQFESRSDAQTFLETANQKLPEGAWPLRL